MPMSRLKSSRRDFLRDASSLIVPGMLLAGSNRAMAKGPRPPAGAVYALTNSTAGNGVVVFLRAANGALTLAKMVPTGGLGLGDGPDSEGLQSQGALVLGPDHHHLYAVNGGSDTISVFAVKPRGLSLVQRIASGGHKPISLTVLISRDPRPAPTYAMQLRANACADTTGFFIPSGTKSVYFIEQ